MISKYFSKSTLCIIVVITQPAGDIATFDAVTSVYTSMAKDWYRSLMGMTLNVLTIMHYLSRRKTLDTKTVIHCRLHVSSSCIV